MKASRHQVQQKPQKQQPTSTKTIPSSTKIIPPSSSLTTNKNIPIYPTKQIKFSYHNYTNLTNQQYLLHSLKLLGVTQQQYLKETKLSLNNNNDQIFAKNQSASTTKQFFFIVITCMKCLCNQQQFSMIKMWYPPRTVNQQLQFKKTLYSLFTKLETKNKVPKNLLISKSFLMAQTPTNKIVQFLRILAQLALRAQYLQKYSKNQRLIDICMKDIQNPQQQSPNDINRIYVYPFVPGQSSSPSIDIEQIQSLKKIYKTHIEIYRKKILSLASKYPKQQPISCQQLMSEIVEQRQLSQMLNKKIPKYVLSQNRAFDRRKLIQQSQYVWSKLYSLQCINVEKSQQTTQKILKLQGQIDKILLKWQTPSGINKMLDVINMTQKLNLLKQNCKKRTQQFNLFYQKLNNQLKKYQ